MTQMLQQSDKYFKIAITIMLEECLKSEKQQKKGRKEYSKKKKQTNKKSRTENSNMCNQNFLDDLKSKMKMTEE